MTNVSERAYESILDLILDGKLGPGTWLREEEMAATLGVSRTPVREALGRLGAEGYVNYQRNRGAEIVRWSRTDIEEIYRMRAMVEGLVARLAAQADIDLQALGLLADQMERSIADQPDRLPTELWRNIADLNGEFHRIVMAAIGSERMYSMQLAQLHVPLVLQTYSHYRKSGLQRSFAHHRELIAALEARDPDWAEAVMRAHVFHARAVLLVP